MSQTGLKASMLDKSKLEQFAPQGQTNQKLNRDNSADSGEQMEHYENLP